MTQEIGRRYVDGQWVTDVQAEGSGGGGSQTENVRLLDLGTITPADLASGPVTLYTPDAGEVVGPVYLYAVELVTLNGKPIQITREEQDGTSHLRPLAAWDNDIVVDGSAWYTNDTNTQGTPVTTGPVKAAFAGSLTAAASGEPWQANHGYLDTDAIIGAGHLWSNEGAGTSGGSPPDFAGNFGGSVVDNDITWDDEGDIAAADGSARVFAQVATPAAP